MSALVTCLVAGLVGLALLAAVGWFVADRRAAVVSRHRFVVRAAIAKALADRSPMVRVPASYLARVFRITDLRVLPDGREFGGKPPSRHPAALPPARRKGL